MSYINPKRSGVHSDNTVTNNGGIAVYIPKGATAAQIVGEKNTETPSTGELAGVNKTVVESNIT